MGRGGHRFLLIRPRRAMAAPAGRRAGFTDHAEFPPTRRYHPLPGCSPRSRHLPPPHRLPRPPPQFPRPSAEPASFLLRRPDRSGQLGLGLSSLNRSSAFFGFGISSSGLGSGGRQRVDPGRATPFAAGRPKGARRAQHAPELFTAVKRSRPALRQRWERGRVRARCHTPGPARPAQQTDEQEPRLRASPHPVIFVTEANFPTHPRSCSPGRSPACPSRRRQIFGRLSSQPANAPKTPQFFGPPDRRPGSPRAAIESPAS